MHSESILFGSLSLALGIASLGLMAYVLIRSPYTKIVKTFVLFLLYFSLSSILSGLMLIDIAEDDALLLGQIASFCFIMSYASFLYLSLVLTHGEAERTHLTTNVFFVMFLVISFLTGLTLTELEPVGNGWMMYGTGLLAMISVISGIILTTAFTLARHYRRSASKDHRRQTIIFILAITSPLMVGTVVSVMTAIGISRPAVVHPFDSLGVLLVLTYAVFRYHLLIVVPVRELSSRSMKAIKNGECTTGKSYIVESMKSAMAYSILLEELNRGAEGLIITREHPDRIRQEYDLAKTPIIWLTNALGPDRIDPTNITIIERVISDYLRKGKRPVVLLDGIEVLILNTNADKVLQMIFNLRDEFITSNGTFLLSVDPRTLDEKTLAMLEKDLDVLADVERE